MYRSLIQARIQTTNRIGNGHTSFKKYEFMEVLSIGIKLQTNNTYIKFIMLPFSCF